jgi:methylmalonyl-CoA mutase N-terminal domain/subunit
LGWWELDAALPLTVLPALQASWRRRAPGLASVALTLASLREQGSSAAYELACLAEAARENPAAGFGLTVSVRVIEEIARLRLARRLQPDFALHGRSLARDLTAGQRDVNLVRVTYQALAAALGGLDSFHALSRDHWRAEEEFESLLLALRTQQVLAAESALEPGRDPLSSSDAATCITQQLEQEVAAFQARIQAAGGWKAALQSGLVHRVARDTTREGPRIGVDRFVMAEPAITPRPLPASHPLPVPEIVAAPEETLFDALVAAAREGAPLGSLNASLALR